MSKKAGTSADEKAAKLLGWFHSTKDFYSIKEIEKAGVKATGINGMIIKDILQALVDDSQVIVEKVGTSNYYWSYPGATATRIQADYDSSDRLVKEAEKKLRDTAQAFEKMKVARGLGGGADQEREDLVQEYTSLQSKLENIKAELSQYAQGDPAVYEQKKHDIEAMKESALRWTDQISTLVSYARDNLGVEKEQMIGMLDLPENFEDLTFPDSKL